MAGAPPNHFMVALFIGGRRTVIFDRCDTQTVRVNLRFG